MAYGVTTSRAHLNRLNMDERFRPQLNELDKDNQVFSEIDWQYVRAWKVNADPSFAGRYFLGTPTRQEIDEDIGFCLWAHGEGSDPSTPDHIVPIQRANPAWQQSTGSTAERLASIEARAFTDYIQRCLDVGDLRLPVFNGAVLVFLEAAEGVPFGDYWRAWARQIYSTPIRRDAHTSETVMPFLPAINCVFEQVSGEGDDRQTYWPERAVREALESESTLWIFSAVPVCHGLWARNVLQNPRFRDFSQQSSSEPIPVFYWRSFDGAEAELPAEMSHDFAQTLRLVKIDEQNPETEDSTQFALVTRPWDPSAPVPPSEDLPLSLPIQFGIDTASRLDDDLASCVANRTIVVRRCPTGWDGNDFGTRLDPPLTLSGSSSFVGRYLHPRTAWLKPEEARAVNANGMMLCSFFQVFLSPLQVGKDPNVFDDGAGYRRGKQAFESAVELGQPAYTPIYFCVDLSVGDDKTHDPSVPSPSLEAVIKYFRDVRDAYRDYMLSDGATPYYIGAYASAKVLNVVYRAGLATHFWQVCAHTFGPPEGIPHDPKRSWYDTSAGWRAWPHLNVWQVLIDAAATEVKGTQADLWADNTVQDCGEFSSLELPWLDINVAWGDPGGWEITS